MRYINFLGVSFYLLLNIFTLYSSEMEDMIEDETNPLKQLKTYFDGSGSFTFDKAEELIEQTTKEGKDIVNSQGTSPERSRNNPLKWLCINGCNLEPLTKENRLEIAKFFVKNGANSKSIKEASLFCLTDINPRLSEANSNIKKLLDSIRNQRRIIIKNKKIKFEKLKKELAGGIPVISTYYSGIAVEPISHENGIIILHDGTVIDLYGKVIIKAP